MEELLLYINDILPYSIIKFYIFFFYIIKNFRSILPLLIFKTPYTKWYCNALVYQKKKIHNFKWLRLIPRTLKDH